MLELTVLENGNMRIYHTDKYRYNSRSPFRLQNIKVAVILDRQKFQTCEKTEKEIVQAEESLKNVLIFEDRGCFYVSNIDMNYDDAPIAGLYYNEKEIRIVFESGVFVCRLDQMNREGISISFFNNFLKKNSQDKNPDENKKATRRSKRNLSIKEANNCRSEVVAAKKSKLNKKEDKLLPEEETEDEEKDGGGKKDTKSQSGKAKKSKRHKFEEEEGDFSTEEENEDEEKDDGGKKDTKSQSGKAKKSKRHKFEEEEGDFSTEEENEDEEETSGYVLEDDSDFDYNSDENDEIESKNRPSTSTSEQAGEAINDCSEESSINQIKKCSKIRMTKLDENILEDQQLDMIKERIRVLFITEADYECDYLDTTKLIVNSNATNSEMVESFKARLDAGKKVSERECITVYKENSEFVVIVGNDRVAAMQKLLPRSIRVNIIQKEQKAEYALQTYFEKKEYKNICNYEKIILVSELLDIVGARTAALKWNDKKIGLVFERVLEKISINIIKLCFVPELVDIVVNMRTKLCLNQAAIKSVYSAYQKRREKCQQVVDELSKEKIIDTKNFVKRMKEIIPEVTKSLTLKGVDKKRIQNFLADHEGDERLDFFGTKFPNRSKRNTKPCTLESQWAKFLKKYFPESLNVGKIRVFDSTNSDCLDCIVLHNKCHPFLYKFNDAIGFVISDKPDEYSMQLYTSVDNKYGLVDDSGVIDNMMSVYIVMLQNSSILPPKECVQELKKRNIEVTKFMGKTALQDMFNKFENIYIDTPKLPPKLISEYIGAASNIYLPNSEDKSVFENLRQNGNNGKK